MKLKILAGVLGAVFIGACWAPTSSALGLKIAPLEYKTTLAPNERQSGVIDISNPSGQSVHVQTSVQAFKQIDNNGSLQFYNDERVAKAIRPSLKELDLGPREALRLPFTIDGATLPSGDVYAAIFFTTDLSTPKNGVGQLVRVGTILSIINKAPGSRSAVVTGVSLPFLQLTDTVSGTYAIKNTGPTDSGFYPTVTLSSWPGGKKKDFESTLVFGGRERQNDFRLQTGFGIHYVTVGYGSSEKGQWVVTLAPWMLVLGVLILFIIGIEVLLYKKRRNSLHEKTLSTP